MAAEPALPEPFRIGVRPLGDAPWLRLDDELDVLCADKRELHARAPSEVHRRAPGDHPFADIAASETLTLVREALHEAGLELRPSCGASDLLHAALAVAEDLAILVREADGWHLVEAVVAAPSAWRLGEKIGRPLGAVHDPVPGFATGSRNDAVIGRMLDALRPGTPVVRGSWSLHADAVRFLPRHAPDHAARLAAGPRAGGVPEGSYLRTERQVLRRLVCSDAVLFSIDTRIRPTAGISLAERDALATQLGAMTPEQRAYRGLPPRPYDRT